MEKKRWSPLLLFTFQLMLNSYHRAVPSHVSSAVRMQLPIVDFVMFCYMQRTDSSVALCQAHKGYRAGSQIQMSWGPLLALLAHWSATIVFE